MEKKRLGDICEIVTGATPKTNITEFWDGDINWITPAELTEDTYIINESLRKITTEGVEKTGLKSFPKGTVILSSRAPIGKVAIAGCEMYCNQGFKNLVCSKQINNRFLYWYLKGHKEYLNSLGRGATFKEISKAIVENIEICLPTLEKQEKYADILEQCNGIIQIKKGQLRKLDTLVKSRFVEMFGDPVANDKEWTTLPLEEACKTIVDCPHSTPSYTTENTGFMCIRTSIVKKNKILWDDIEYIPEDEFIKRIQRKKPEIGDVVYTREGAILGIAAIIDRECNVALGQRSMLLSPDANKCLSEFLCVAMNCDSFLDNALKGIAGSASPHINVGDIKSFKMIMPPIELQNQFADFVQQVDKSKSKIQKSLEETQLLFDSLMQKYFG